jgi:hypothetical protein
MQILIIALVVAIVAAFVLYDRYMLEKSLVTQTSILHVDGRYLKNDKGQVVTLEGVNAVGYADEPGGYWRPEGGDLWSGGGWQPIALQQNLDRMKQSGFNSIRLHTVVKFWKNNSLSFINHFKFMISEADKRGMYVIVDISSIRAYPNQTQYPVPYGQWASDSADRIIMPDREAFVSLWKDTIAANLKAYGNVLFEIYNEPHDAENEYFTMAQEVINAIRSTGAAQPIVISYDWSIWADFSSNSYGNLSWISRHPLTDTKNNLVYSFHSYYSQLHNGTQPLHDYIDLQQAWNACLVQQFASQHPLLIGETGASMHSSDLSNELDYLRNTLKLANDLGVNWEVFVWSSPAQIQWGILQDTRWIPPLNEAGTIVVQAIQSSSP